METNDTCCTLVPYFKVHKDQMSSFKSHCERFVERTKEEEGVMFYGFSFDGDQAHCREGYKNAEGILNHLDNVGDILQEVLKIADITRLEIHGPKAEVDKLRKPLEGLNPQFYALEYGFRR